MMGVMNFKNKIRHGQLQLMHPEPSGFRLWCQPMARSEIEQDVGGVPDQKFTGFEKRRSKWRRAASRLDHLHHRPHAMLPRDIGVTRTDLFHREADIFAAALNGGPGLELIPHRASLPC